jgi:hypothetical protein
VVRAGWTSAPPAPTAVATARSEWLRALELGIPVYALALIVETWARRATASTTNDLERVVGQLLKAEKAFAGLDLAPLLRAASGVNVIARQVDMVSEIARTSNVLQAASIASQLGPIFKQMNDSVHAPLGAYLDIAQRLPRAEIASAFAGMTEALSAIRASEPVFAQVGLLARLAASG